MQKIVTHLWFDTQAEEAARFYASAFRNSKVGAISRYSEAASKMAGRPPGSVMTVAFELEGQQFLALNGGPMFTFSEAISLVVNCVNQAEIDDLWSKLTAGGGKAVQCGWLKDKFGLSWQIVPTVLTEMMQDQNAKKAEAVMAALMPMVKLDIAALQKAYDAA